jgi:hypothetical protein
MSHTNERAHFKNVSAKILAIFNPKCDALPFLGDGSTRFYLVVPVATMVAVGRHDYDILPDRLDMVTPIIGNRTLK